MIRIILIILMTIGIQANAQVPISFAKIGTKYGVDPALMYALSITESGRKSSFGMVTAWPWTANICDRAPGVRCKGYWFQSREELYEKLVQELNRGNDWFDVGIMQMNWHFHKTRFGNDLWMATQPLVNTNQAVGLLKEILKKHQNSLDIYAAYHAGIGWKSKNYSPQRLKQIQAYAVKTARTYERIKTKEGSNEKILAQN